MAPTFNAIGIVTTDLAASLDFYRRLGVDVPADQDGQVHAEGNLSGGLRMLWDSPETIRSFDPGWTPPAGSPRTALAFACADPAEVDATYADLVKAGHQGHLEPWDAVWGMRYAVVHDPDGNPVDLFAPLE
jgi:catechol 2,3-dioxygenase-like lactoylglutathione lyase family enzyme